MEQQTYSVTDYKTGLYLGKITIDDYMYLKNNRIGYTGSDKVFFINSEYIESLKENYDNTHLVELLQKSIAETTDIKIKCTETDGPAKISSGCGCVIFLLGFLIIVITAMLFFPTGQLIILGILTLLMQY